MGCTCFKLWVHWGQFVGCKIRRRTSSSSKNQCRPCYGTFETELRGKLGFRPTSIDMAIRTYITIGFFLTGAGGEPYQPVSTGGTGS